MTPISGCVYGIGKGKDLKKWGGGRNCGETVHVNKHYDPPKVKKILRKLCYMLLFQPTTELVNWK